MIESLKSELEKIAEEKTILKESIQDLTTELGHLKVYILNMFDTIWPIGCLIGIDINVIMSDILSSFFQICFLKLLNK